MFSHATLVKTSRSELRDDLLRPVPKFDTEPTFPANRVLNTRPLPIRGACSRFPHKAGVVWTPLGAAMSRPYRVFLYILGRCELPTLCMPAQTPKHLRKRQICHCPRRHLKYGIAAGSSGAIRLRTPLRPGFRGASGQLFNASITILRFTTSFDALAAAFQSQLTQPSVRNSPLPDRAG